MPAQEAGSNDARRDLQRHIGQTVRKLRLQQNLTIVEIARKAHISSGMLSKIENSQTSASLDSLASLADALGTTLASLFTGFSSEEGGAQHVKSGHAPEVVRRGTKRGHTYHLLAIERGPRRVFEPFLVTLNDKSEIFPGFEHPGIEFIYLLQGRLRYRHGKSSYLLAPGDSLTFRGSVPHGPERLLKLPITMLAIIIYDDEMARLVI
jgi:quercetin dioxygenase-like cupin family protein/DNA-binding XRE family transcriptional regulator